MVAWFFPSLAELHLDEASVPEKEVTPLRSREHLAIRQLHIGRNVRDLYTPKLAELALQLKTREGEGHLPESGERERERERESEQRDPKTPKLLPSSPYVSSARGSELLCILRREGYPVYVLREGLAAQHNLLLHPVPHGEHVVWIPANGGQQITVPRTEVHVTVHRLSTTSQDPMEAEIRISINSYDWIHPFLSDSKKLPSWMNL